MHRFVFSVPTAWQSVSPGRFLIGDATLTVSEIAPLPEHLVAYLNSELRRVAGPGLAGVEITPIKLDAGWRGSAAQASFGASNRLVMAIQVVDLGVLVHLDGPTAGFDATRAQVERALGTATIDWGEPEFLTLVELLDGVQR